MGDIGELYNDLREHKKEQRAIRGTNYIPRLESAGAVFMTDGVYRLGDFDCYPYKGYARDYRTNRRTCIEFVLRYKGIGANFPAPKKKSVIKHL